MVEARQLEQEYCPPLDPSLLYALALDYDLEDAAACRELRWELDILKASAESDGALAFDLPGSGNDIGPEDTRASSPPSRGRRSRHGSLTEAVDDSTSASITDSSYGDAAEYDVELETVSDVEKEELLRIMFPELKVLDIQLTLRRSGDFDAVVDELLNQHFLQLGLDINGERTSIPRGIDGFFVDDDSDFKTSKRKGKKRHQARSSSLGSGSSLGTAPTSSGNYWDRASDDIAFITARTVLHTGLVQSAYHVSHASLADTILSLCQTYGQPSQSMRAHSPALASATIELSDVFPNLPMTTLSAILNLTGQSPNAAAELASVLSASSAQPTASESLPLPPQPRPITPPVSTPFTFVRSRSSSRHSKHFAVRPSSGSVANLHATHAATLAAASAAFRRARSQQHRGAVAGHYASLANDAGRRARQHASALADAQVARQSTSRELDLHGVSVADAVRLAKERTQAWWEGGAAEWAREGKVAWGAGAGGRRARGGEDGLRVIVGKGNHSAGGKAKIGPAVEKALRADGWRVEVGEGVLVVEGRKR